MEPCSIENLSILYQSAAFLVVNKHWDIRIDSKMWYEKITVQIQLKHKFPELADPDTYYGFRFCHQLDFSTSGALCVALNKEAAGRAYKCFKDRTVTKVYLALVRGTVAENFMTTSLAIGKNTQEGLTHMMCAEGTLGCENAKPCQTNLIVLEHGSYKGDPVTKVLLQPLTGRTHQLRVHCSALGYPIVGDFTYSFKKDNDPYRMMLHAYYLHIPTNSELVEVTAPDPFQPDKDPNWMPVDTVCSLSTAMKDIIAIAKASEINIDKLQRESTENKPKGKDYNKDTEKQRAMCQQWLSEWASE
ncbi:hypothetical protein GDO86_011431 [Hymenochirus boettgeri]|uniref:Pseudouridine synthase RsuA/RluA-like domain-containing protein n=1 Tax=Hymenochirus boettgeri TaxID=247094 RepID=A0A8T2JH36_9PIPI|nr:hypothetical protein GDO86_016669 [Hymenochirus boettgeri]KAG8433694.1 hypothetical protein GDO86_012157 [Hymenochirus boettgeri]KAG8442640.1 hypothetical protein GDO86_011431 [Hymenochirus boettgeri]